jgi:hypothetical protein
MEWCLDCHRAPEKYIRPRSEVFNMAYEPPTEDHPRVLEDGQRVANQMELGLHLKHLYNVPGLQHMTSCSVCHR